MYPSKSAVVYYLIALRRPSESALGCTWSTTAAPSSFLEAKHYQRCGSSVTNL